MNRPYLEVAIGTGAFGQCGADFMGKGFGLAGRLRDRLLEFDLRHDGRCLVSKQGWKIGKENPRSRADAIRNKTTEMAGGWTCSLGGRAGRASPTSSYANYLAPGTTSADDLYGLVYPPAIQFAG